MNALRTMHTATAQVTKTYDDGSFDIDTMPVDTARAHVRLRTANPASFGLRAIEVRIAGATYDWTKETGWTR